MKSHRQKQNQTRETKPQQVMCHQWMELLILGMGIFSWVLDQKGSMWTSKHTRLCPRLLMALHKLKTTPIQLIECEEVDRSQACKHFMSDGKISWHQRAKEQ